MGKLKQSVSLAGELDGVRHAIEGIHNKNITGHRMETYDITTSYTMVEKVTNSLHTLSHKLDPISELKDNYVHSQRLHPERHS